MGQAARIQSLYGNLTGTVFWNWPENGDFRADRHEVGANRLVPHVFHSQLVNALIRADIANGHAHVLKLLPRSAGLAAALALSGQSVAGTGLLDVLPAREYFLRGGIRIHCEIPFRTFRVLPKLLTLVTRISGNAKHS